jgi:hypothetical protein
VILEDDELNIPSVENADMPTLAAVNISTVELKKPTDLSLEARFDIESGPNVLEDCPLPALEEDGVASVAVPQDQHLSAGRLEDTINQHNNGDAQSTSEVLGADTLPQLLNDGGGQKCADNITEVDRG